MILGHSVERSGAPNTRDLRSESGAPTCERRVDGRRACACSRRVGRISGLAATSLAPHPPWPLAVEQWALLIYFAVNELALFVARRLRYGGHRDAPPLAPPSKVGETLRNTRGGNHRSLVREFSTAHPGPPFPRGGKGGAFARGEGWARGLRLLPAGSETRYRLQSFIRADLQSRAACPTIPFRSGKCIQSILRPSRGRWWRRSRWVLHRWSESPPRDPPPRFRR